MLKNGMHIATSVTPNGQYDAGCSGMLVMPNIDVTNVRG
jgi:hypothetical protein